MFPHAAYVVALADRLIDCAEVIEKADSYRFEEVKELSAARTKQRRVKKG